MTILIAITSVLTAAAGTKPPLVIADQGSFFVGGHNIHSETLSDVPDFAPVGTFTTEQMYVHYQIPVNAHRYSITLIHGCCLTGKTWETTPDGRMGWDEYFVRKGYPIYVVDQVYRGRSSGDITGINSVKMGKASMGKLPNLREVGHELAWVNFRFGPEYGKVFSGMQFPVDAQGEFWKQMVPDWTAMLDTPNPNVSALSELAQRLKGTVLMSHSQSGIFPFQTAALRTSGIAGIVALEPAACPTATEDLTPYLKIPSLVVFGDYVDQSPRWAARLKACTEFAQAVTKSGGKAEVVELPKIGIKGNSHMLMQDKNNIEVADWLVAWIGKIK